MKKPLALSLSPNYFPFPGGASTSLHAVLSRLVQSGFDVEALVPMRSFGPFPTASLPARESRDGVVQLRLEPQALLRLLPEKVAAADVIFFQQRLLLRGLDDLDVEAILEPHRKKVVYFSHNFAADGDYYPGGLAVANSVWCRSQMPPGDTTDKVILTPMVATPTPMPEKPRRFVTIVNPCREKGGDVFVELAKRMPNVSFLAQIGWGKPVAELKGLPNVTIRPPTDDMSSVYAETEVLLVPSQWNEAFGMVALEGALAGCLVLAKDAAGLRDVPLAEESYVASASVDDWEVRLRALLERSSAERAALRAETIAKARTYAPRWDVVVEKVRELAARAHPPASLRRAAEIARPAELFGACLEQKLAADPQLGARIGARFRFVVTGPDGGTWRVDFGENVVIAKDDTTGDVDCTIRIGSADLVDVVNRVRCFESLAKDRARVEMHGRVASAWRLVHLWTSAGPV